MGVLVSGRRVAAELVALPAGVCIAVGSGLWGVSSVFLRGELRLGGGAAMMETYAAQRQLQTCCLI